MIPGFASPAPQLGRTGLLPTGVRHFALPNTLVIAGSAYSAEPLIYGGRDDLHFLRARLRGDISRYQQAGSDKAGAFQPICHLIHGGRIYLGGRLTDDGNNSRAVLFSAAIGPNPVWKLLATGIEGPKGSGGYRGIVGIAAKGSQLVALSSTGEIAVSDDGEAWQAYPNVGIVGVNAANALAGSDAGFLVCGNSGQALTAADPRGAWTSRTSAFGTANILAALCVGNLFVIAGGARVATANGLANFTSRAVPAGVHLDRLMGVAGRIFAGGSGWLTSTDGAAWMVPADTPMKGETSRIRSGYWADGRWVVHWGGGRVSVSENNIAWTEIVAPKLPSQFWCPVAYAI